MGLTLRDITFTHAPGTPFATRALEGVSLDVASGELVLVLGATGSGKSTLLRIAAGLLRADGGTASIDDAPLDAKSARGAVGLAFQNPEQQLFAESVLEDVAFGPRNLGADADEAARCAREALEAVGLDADAFSARSPFTLSGGEARRVALAGVLAMRPSYLLLDEPTAGLDVRGREALRDTLERVRADVGVVVVSHDAEELLGQADRVLLLSEGRPAFAGSPAELLADPAAFERAGLLAPEVVRVQMLGAARGRLSAPFALDPRAAAALIIAGGGERL